MASSDFLSSGSCLKNLLNLVVKFPKTFKGSFHSVIFLIFYNSQPYRTPYARHHPRTKYNCCCSCSKFLSQILKIVVKNFSEIVPGKQTQKEGFRPLIFLTHSMRITLLIIIEFDPCIYAVKFNFIPFQVPLYQAADVIQNRT